MKYKIVFFYLIAYICLLFVYDCHESSTGTTADTTTTDTTELIFSSTVLFTPPQGFITGIESDNVNLYIGWREDYFTLSTTRLYAVDRETGQYTVMYEEDSAAIYGITNDSEFVYIFCISDVDGYVIRRININTKEETFVADLNGLNSYIKPRDPQIFEDYIYFETAYKDTQDRIVRIKADGSSNPEDYIILDFQLIFYNFIEFNNQIGIAFSTYASNQSFSCSDKLYDYPYSIYLIDPTSQKVLADICSIGGVMIDTHENHLFFKESDNVWSVDLNGNRKQLTSDNKDSDGLPLMLVDDSYVYFFRDTNETVRVPLHGELFMVSQQGGTPIRISEEYEISGIFEFPTGIVDDKYLYIQFGRLNEPIKIVRYEKRRP